MEDSPAKNLPCQRRTQPNGNIFQSMAHFAGHPKESQGTQHISLAFSLRQTQFIEFNQ